MYLSHLRLTNFRSYTELNLPLGPGTSVFFGPNGHGKTNILEAVHFLATLGSHRVAADQPLIRQGAQVATVGAKVHAGVSDDRSLSVAVDIRLGMPNKALLNRAPVRPRDILGALRTVFFAPEDLAIVRGDPSERRTFIDELVTTRWPRMAGVRADYDRALKQKTALLKALSGRGMRSGGEGAEQTLSSWDEAMVTCGGELVAARLRTLADLAPLITETYDALAPIASAASAIYHSSNLKKGMESDVELVRQCLAEAMEARRGEELTRGICLVGPHRDDIILSLADLPVRGYASHGEGWSLALALRLASLDLLQADGVEPVLILDDVFAELDEHRRARVVEAMDRVEQTLISVAVRRDLPSNLQAHLFEVGLGVVCPLGEDSGDSSTILKEGMT